MSESALRLSGIAKSYGAHTVLTDVSLEVGAGEVTALLGENGAGKSTLAKIIAGVQTPDAGSLSVGGESHFFDSPRTALRAGVAFIPQELIYVPELTVAENICLGMLPGRGGIITQRKVIDRARQLADSVGFELPLSSRMSSVPLMQQQLAIILRTLAGGPRVMVLDEPTAALEARDSTLLLSLVRRLADQGVALVYISHRLEEVFTHCDTVHVLREGHLVLSGSTAELSRGEVVHAMIDKEMDDVELTRPRVRGGDPVFRATEWCKPSHPVLSDVTVDAASGEVVGLYGLRGGGAETFAEALAGLHPDAAGRIFVGAHQVKVDSPHAAQRAGIRHVPADRKSQGLVMGSSIIDSMSLPDLTRVSTFGWMRTGRALVRAKQLATQTLLRASRLGQPVGDLSGGNQQKVLLGSRLTADARVLVLQEPSRGVDVNARLEIHRLLRELAEDGIPQIIASSDLEELVIVCDRILVFHGGRIVHEVRDPAMSSQSEILHYAGGLEL